MAKKNETKNNNKTEAPKKGLSLTATILLTIFLTIIGTIIVGYFVLRYSDLLKPHSGECRESADDHTIICPMSQ